VESRMACRCVRTFVQYSMWYLPGQFGLYILTVN
jgi:hypothetical protein